MRKRKKPGAAGAQFPRTFTEEEFDAITRKFFDQGCEVGLNTRLTDDEAWTLGYTQGYDEGLRAAINQPSSEHPPEQ